MALEETILSTDFITDAAYITLAPALTLEFEDIDEAAPIILTAVKDVEAVPFIEAKPSFSTKPSEETEEVADFELFSFPSITPVTDS